jgi:hypothetical protein
MAAEHSPDIKRVLGIDSIERGTMSRSQQQHPGLIGQHGVRTASHVTSLAHTYSISGNPGDLGSMFLTEAQEKLQGTWYDRTDAVRAFRLKEAKLGKSEYADAEFRESAGRILSSLKKPVQVDADIHFEHDRSVETVEVSGNRGARSFRFDREAAETAVIPEGGDVFKPFYDAIDEIIALILKVR